ncbi:MAG: hypothetical protein ABIP51_17045 [Bacteroidia bacterium]
MLRIAVIKQKVMTKAIEEKVLTKIITENKINQILSRRFRDTLSREGHFGRLRFKNDVN